MDFCWDGLSDMANSIFGKELCPRWLLRVDPLEAEKLAEKGLVDPALEKGLEPFTAKLTSFYDKKIADKD